MALSWHPKAAVRLPWHVLIHLAKFPQGAHHRLSGVCCEGTRCQLEGSFFRGRPKHTSWAQEFGSLPQSQGQEIRCLVTLSQVSGERPEGQDPGSDRGSETMQVGGRTSTDCLEPAHFSNVQVHV